MYRDRENAYMEETLRGIRRQQTAGDVDAGTLNARRREFQQIVDRREERREEIAALDSAMRSAPETILTRRSIDPRVYERMRQTLRPGDRFTDDAFTSVSIDPTANLGVPGQPGSMMNVILTEGTPTLWAGGSRSPGTQNEVIIGRGTTFEVVSANNEQGWVLRTVPSSSGYNPPPVPNYVSPDVSAFIAEAPPPPRNPTPNDLTFSPSLDRFRLYRQDFSRPQIGSDTETRVGVWDQIIRESRQGEQDILRARVMEGKKMYFKHLRGKHDQKDHESRGGARSGGSRSGGSAVSKLTQKKPLPLQTTDKKTIIRSMKEHYTPMNELNGINVEDWLREYN